MSAELAQEIKNLQNQLKAMQSQAEVYQAELQEKVNQALAYRTNLHITQKAFKEVNDAKVALEKKVAELEDKVKVSENKEVDAA